MERRRHEETAEGSRSHQSTLTGTLALKNFTIPRKKRTSGEVLLECCSEESRDYSLIQTKLKDFKLDTRKDQANAWDWKDVCLVHNEELLKKFSEKRAEMRAKGRHGREMEERFCFLAATDQLTTQIYQHGLPVGSTTQHALGKPSYGVYLFKHVDVALKSACTSAKKLFIFKVLYGKVKKIAPCLDWNKTQDPTVAFDCHMCKDAASHRDTLHQQILGSAVFLFDFNEKQELTERPRQCLPYAVVSFVPVSSAIQTLHTNLPTLPIGQVNDRYKACTVAERRGKGNTATITFKRFGTPHLYETDYTPQNPRVESLFQKADMQNTQSLNLNQHWTPASEDSELSSCSVPVVDHTALSENWLGNKSFLSTHKQNAERKENKCDTISQTPVDKISTVVYSSRLVRDPRLSRQDANQQTNCSKPEEAYTDSGCDDRNYKPVHQNQENNYGFAGNQCKDPSSMDQENAERDRPLKFLMNDQSTHAPILPSMRLFKLKFQKYAAYFKMNEEERHQYIWSRENMSPEQKQELADRIDFYDIYYQKYKKGLLFPKPNKAKTSSLSQTEPKESIKQTKDNEFKLNLQCVDTEILSENNYLLIKDNCSSTHIHETKHPDHPQVLLKEMGNDCLLKMQDYVPSDKLSEKTSLLGLSNLNITDENTNKQFKHIKQPSPLTCSCNEAKLNHIEHELCRSVVLQENESNPGVNLVEIPNTENANNITIMDIASFMEVSSCGTSDCNLSSVMAEKEKQNVKICNSVKDTDSFKCEKCCEISPEFDMETVQQELYRRLQLDQLLPSKNQKHVFSSKAFLMSRPTDTISKPKNDNEDHCEAATSLNMKSCEDNHFTITLKSNKTSTDIKEMLSLSERFSKIKVLQSKIGKRRNKMMTGTQMCNNEGHKEDVICNAELIQLLALKYSKSKILKCKKLSKSDRKKISFEKQHTSLSIGHSFKRRKYAKKTHFWRAKKNRSRKLLCPHAAVNSHTSETVLTDNKDPEPGSNLRITSEDDGSIPQGHCSPVMSVISKDLPPSMEFNTIPQTKEKPIVLTEPSSEDLSKSDSDFTEKATKDFTSREILLMVDEGEQMKATESSSNQNKASSATCTTNDYSTVCKEGNMLLKETSETRLNPLNKEHFTIDMSVENNLDASENLATRDCGASETEVQTSMTPEDKVMDTIGDTSNTGPIQCTVQNISMEGILNVQCIEGGKHTPADIPNENKSCLDIINTSNGNSVSSTETEVHKDITLNSKPCSPEDLKCASSNIVDLTVDDSALSGQCEISEQTKSSVIKSPRTLLIKDNSESPRPDKNDDANSPETQLISKLRDYLTKFESTVKKQESASEDLKERPVVWITLDSTAHKQQLFEKGQYCMVNLPCLVPNETDAVMSGNSSNSTETSVQNRKASRSENAQIGSDVCLLVPIESKRGRRFSQYKRTSRQRSRRSSVISVSPDSTSALDIVKDCSSFPVAKENDQKTGSPEISINNTLSDHIQMQRKSTTSQQNLLVNPNSLCEQKSKENQSVNMTKNIDDGNVSSTFAENKYSINDISDTLKMADQTVLLTELESLQSKCKNMLQHFISSFERDQKIPFNQSFVSRHLILEQYLDHPPAQVDLKYEAINSYLELQMMMEAWQFVDNKINFLRGKPTFRSLLWYDPSLYGELYKGEVGFQQQSSLFASFQKILAQDGDGKLQEYYHAVSSLHQQLHAAPDASYYMYLKSKRELLEAEAALRNPRDIKSFFLSVPVAATINFGDSLENLEKVHKVIMTFVETPSDQLPGTFDVGKAEHLSIACRYLQEKELFIRSCKEMISKISWFGIEHLLYDASKVLVWHDMNHGAPSEALETYKNSNPQIIFGVTESGVTLVNKVEQPPPPTDGQTQQKNEAARKRKCLQLWMSSEPSVSQGDSSTCNTL
ncbi:uncharacterized protein LOC130236146 isoform X2 [Danio aesculapii]|uniref:uncharacterized protein LOC130236146 isoform X2 n=1 Tax=Danio aesculapii TaxID=1142201 RepID=UPI0024BF9B20|nr:uncharacterized protein LOC130236146 isoform X2 [Danio aesculapii]